MSSLDWAAIRATYKYGSMDETLTKTVLPNDESGRALIVVSSSRLRTEVRRDANCDDQAFNFSTTGRLCGPARTMEQRAFVPQKLLLSSSVNRIRSTKTSREFRYTLVVVTNDSKSHSSPSCTHALRQTNPWQCNLTKLLKIPNEFQQVGRTAIAQTALSGPVPIPNMHLVRLLLPNECDKSRGHYLRMLLKHLQYSYKYESVLLCRNSQMSTLLYFYSHMPGISLYHTTTIVIKGTMGFPRLLQERRTRQG
jgi:hypothetical protein